jgi:hypothetical protein
LTACTTTGLEVLNDPVVSPPSGVAFAPLAELRAVPQRAGLVVGRSCTGSLAGGSLYGDAKVANRDIRVPQRAGLVVGRSCTGSLAGGSLYGDAKVANRDIRVPHGATENGP